jgi:hypothetical protein
MPGKVEKNQSVQLARISAPQHDPHSPMVPEENVFLPSVTKLRPTDLKRIEKLGRSRGRDLATLIFFAHAPRLAEQMA